MSTSYLSSITRRMPALLHRDQPYGQLYRSSGLEKWRSLRYRDHRGLWQLIFLRVYSQAGLRNTFDTGNNFFLISTVFQADADNILFAIGNYFKIFNETFSFQNLSNSLLWIFGAGDFNFIVMNRVCVTNTGKHIGNRVSHYHT